MGRFRSSVTVNHNCPNSPHKFVMIDPKVRIAYLLQMTLDVRKYHRNLRPENNI
jgi:hypothetical protein